ncbi:MAG: hypothetical protein ACU84J_16525 [Gammaproteobacteria bacterium]
MNTNNLPFSMTTESVSEWLSRISQLDTIPAGQELYSALKKLLRIKLKDDDFASTLDQITPAVLHISVNLSAFITANLGAEGVVNKKTRKPARLGAQLIRTLCLCYCRAVDEQPLGQEQKVRAVFIALQLIGFSIKIHTLFSERPSMTLWQKMTVLYRIAVDEELFEEPVSHKIPLFKNQKSIASVIKRNLLYALFDLYRAPAAQLTRLYEIAEQCAETLVFSHTANNAYNFCWPVSEAKFPRSGKSQGNIGSILPFNTEAVTKFIKDHIPDEEQRDPFFIPIWHKLTGYWEIIDSVIPSKPTLYNLDTGFNGVIDKLSYYKRITNIQRLSAELPEPSPLRTLELEPMGHEKQAHQLRREDIPEHFQATQLKSGIAYLQPARTPNFFLTRIKAEAVPNNFPILLFNKQETPKFGIIRFTNLLPESGNQTALIETLPGRLSLVRVSLQSQTIDAVLIQLTSKREALVLPPGKYVTGDSIGRSDQPGKAYYLSRMIEANDQFMIYRIDAG